MDSRCPLPVCFADMIIISQGDGNVYEVLCNAFKSAFFSLLFFIETIPTNHLIAGVAVVVC